MATSIYESWYLYQNTSQYSNATINFAEQFLLQCSNYGDCSGGSVADALSYAVSFGMPNETDFPYGGTTTQYGVPNTSSSYTCSSIKARTNKVNRTTYVNRYGNISIDLMTRMVSNFVVGTWLAADSGLFQYTASSNATVPYNCSSTIYSDYQLNLPVSVVGYDDSRNLIVQVSGKASMGGTIYNSSLQTGLGFVKISSSSAYCGGLRRVCQLWYNSSSNYYNNSNPILLAANALILAMILIY